MGDQMITNATATEDMLYARMGEYFREGHGSWRLNTSDLARVVDEHVATELQALVTALIERHVEFCAGDQPQRAGGVSTAIDLLRTRIEEMNASKHPTEEN